jgi:hypothetical protein
MINAIPLFLSKFSMGFGILVIVLLSCDDFRKNVRRFISRWRYYFAGSIFVTINLFVYLVVTYAFIQETPTDIIYKDIIIQGNYLDMLMPLLLAFAYFGAGAGTFRFGSKEIQLSKKLREILEGLFNSKPLEPSDVNYAEKETEQLYAKLLKSIEKVDAVAKEKKWGELGSKWEDFKEDEAVLNEQMIFLKGINKKLVQIHTDLDNVLPAAEKLTEAMQEIHDRIGNILIRLTKKAQKLLVAFAFKYYKDEAKLEQYLIGIEVLNPDKGQLPNIPNIINRSLILGFMFGLLFGPLYGIIRNEDVIYYCWRGAFALTLFTGCISYGVHSGSWMRSVLVSSMGGFGAHLLWNLIDKKNLNLLTQHSFDWIMKPELFEESIVGLSFGITTALILFALKFHLRAKVPSKSMLYTLSMLSGALSYPLLYLAFSSQNVQSTPLFLVAGIGAIAMSSLAIAVNIDKGAAKQSVDPQLQNDPGYCLDCNPGRDRAVSH